MNYLTMDSETVGLCGIAVILQYKYDYEEDVKIFEIWKRPIRDTLELIEEFCDNSIVGFNLSFDLFHISKLYTCFRLLDPNDYPDPKKVASVEREATQGPCVKAKGLMDIMLWARKTEFQSLMKRKDIRIKKIPKALAEPLANELERRIRLHPIFFARRKKKNLPQWTVYENEDDSDFCDVCMKFAPSTALKALAAHVLKLNEVTLYSDIEIGKEYLPEEYGWAPFADITKNNWTKYIKDHINHWSINQEARKYAMNDVLYTERLYEYFGKPEFNDDDSVLAGSVASCRWRGYPLDIEGLKREIIETKKKINVPTAPREVKNYLEEVMSPTEISVMEGTTKKVVLEKISKFDSLAGLRAKEVLEARSAKLEINMFEKLILAERFHPDFNVIGTLSSRMSGTGGLNPQAIDTESRVREKFLLAEPPMILCGGDYEAFEVVIAIAAWGDEKLKETVTSYRQCHKCEGSGGLYGCKKCKGMACNYCLNKLQTCYLCGGKGQSLTKIHALFGTYLYKGMTYEQILDSDGSADNKYTKAKSMLFAMLYGGEAYTLANRGGLDQEEAEQGYQRFIADYPVVGIERSKVFNKFRCLSQEGGIGSKVNWYDPAEYIEESVTKQRRYYTLENRICKTLYDLANKPPRNWNDLKIKVQRRDRLQTASGAVQSALYAAAFQVQGQNQRSAANHLIQSAGARITKATQRAIWDIQPAGIHEWRVQPINIHDEIQCPVLPEYRQQLKEVVQRTVTSFQDRVPLLKIDWKENMPSWAGKK